MFNLIIKDILIQKKSILFALFYCFFLVFTFQSLDQAGPIVGNVAVVYFLLISSFAYEDKNKSEIMLNSLPISRKCIVTAKYLSVLVYMGLSTLAYMVATLIIKMLKIPINVPFINLEAITSSFVSVALLTSIYLPIVFKFSYIKSKLFNLVIFLIFFIGSTAVVNIYSNPNHQQFLENLFKSFIKLPDWQIGLLLVIFSLIMLLISYSISVRIYKKREF